MEQCNYVDQIRSKLGIQYDDDLFSHTIFDNHLCIQSDDEKTATNVTDLQHALSIPIYYVIAHGVIATNIKIKKDKKLNNHITVPESTFFKLQRTQYVYDTAPIGSVLMCTPALNDYVNQVINHPTEFVDALFSTNFKQVSSPVSGEDVDIDAPLFSPPQFSTINKRLRFYDDNVNSSLRFGIIQLNKEMDDEVLSILSSIGTPSTTSTLEEKQLRCFNLIVSEPGKLTSNPDAEVAFVNHMKSNNFRCSLEELTSTFGHGIYIMATCTSLQVNINVNNQAIVQYSTETGMTPETIEPSHLKMVEKALYSFNSDLESVVYNLNYRWNEMVQHKEEVELATELPHLNVNTNARFSKLREPLNYSQEDEEVEEDKIEDEAETATQPDEEDYQNIGGKKKKRKHPKKTRKNKKGKTLKCRPRSTRSRHRRS